MSEPTAAVPSSCCGRDGGCICAKEATCSCGKQAAMHCNCEKAQTENKIAGAKCSCSKSTSQTTFLPCFWWNNILLIHVLTLCQTNARPVNAHAAARRLRTPSLLVRPARAASAHPVSRRNEQAFGIQLLMLL